jgi:hypothetical protein
MPGNELNTKHSGKTPYALLLLLCCVLLNNWITREFILTHEVYYNLYRDTVAPHRIEEYIRMIEGLSTWSYLLAPVLLLMQVTLITLFIQLPLLLKFIDVPFSHLMHISSMAHIPLCLLGLSKSLWLKGIPINLIAEKHFAYTPLAVTHFVDYEQTSPLLFVFLGNFHLVTFVWLSSLIIGLVLSVKLSIRTAFTAVLVTWATLLTFQYMFLIYFNKIN